MIRTLVVDDDYRVAELHSAYVGRVPGFALVGRAHSGGEALAKVDELHPDLILLDIYLPDISGLEVLQRLREGGDRSDVDVISVTAARDVDSLRSAMRGGVVHYLIKPFRFAAFEEKLSSYAAARERIRRLTQADQSDVDRIFSALRTENEPLPKGLSDTTLELVLGALRGSGQGLAAASIADLAGVSRVTARRYLDHLCRLGKAELTMRYGGPGRPEHRYRLLAS